MEGAFVSAELDGLEHRLASNLREPYILKPFLQLRDVFGREWARQWGRSRFRARWTRQRQLDDDMALQFVERKGFSQRRSRAQGEHRVREVWDYAPAIVRDRPIKP